MANASKNTTASRKTQGKKPAGSSKSKNYSRTKKVQAEDDSLIDLRRLLKKDVVIILAFALSILTLLSLFHKGGAGGEFLRLMVLGTFGLIGYIFPFLMFFGTCFFISNKNNSKARFKMGAFLSVAILLCGVIQIITQDGFDKTLKFSDYFAITERGVQGGLVGGIIVKIFTPFLGTIGTVLMLLVLILIGLVALTEKSVVDYVGKKSNRVYEQAKEDMGRRWEESAIRREERRKYRAEQKVSGVAFNTSLGDETDEERDSKGTFEEKKVNTADVFTGAIHLPKPYERSEDKKEADIFEKLLPDVAEIEAIMLEKEKRTLSELEGYIRPSSEPFWTESLGGEFSQEEPSYIDETPIGFEPVFFEDTKLLQEPFFEPEPESEPVLEPVLQKEENTPEASDFKEIVTASGKVIKVEAEPKEAYPLSKNKMLSKSSLETSVRSSEVMEKPKVIPKPVEKPRPPAVYKYPPVDLLSRGAAAQPGNINHELRETAIKLQQTLQNFGVGVTVTDISCGPAVTRYELQPEQGVKVSKIVSLTDDIKLNLAAADIRIEAPIPGKAAVGIEVPNKENQVVHFRDLLESPDFKKHSSRICFGVGKDIAGKTVVADIAKMPHLLIAGATGSGKSVCINTLIMSILYKANPSDVKLIMIDPKVVELSVYNGIPHLLIPVVTDPKKASGALNWAVAEMSDRYKKFANYNVRDLNGYNEKIKSIEDIEDDQKPQKLPQIIIIVDELADLMMVAPGEVEDAICRLAQLARAAGIHLVIATQRPSVNVITGLIKANVPSRIAFSVSSGVDSRTIIDMNGAEKLLGKGDMLFYPSGYPKPVRVQGAFISDSEVTKVVEFLVNQGIEDDYGADLESKINSAGGQESSAQSSSDGKDAYFEQAGRFIIEKEKASIGMLQRAFKIGFNRAARIMDQLSDAGIVGEEEGTKPRKVLMTMEEFNTFIGECL